MMTVNTEKVVNRASCWASDPAGRTSEPAGRASNPAERALGPAGRAPEGGEGEEKRSRSQYMVVTGAS